MANPPKDTWSADAYNKSAAFVYSSAFTSPVLTLLAAAPGEKIIDFGCGSGEVTLELEKIVGLDGITVGIDSSESMASESATAFEQALRT
jgi:ubiquinone/menaquinone biosynthesis C-methylase UbiE